MQASAAAEPEGADVHGAGEGSPHDLRRARRHRGLQGGRHVSILDFLPQFKCGHLYRGIIRKCKNLHCKKRFAIFPSPAGMSLTKLSLAGNYYIIPAQEEFGK